MKLIATPATLAVAMHQLQKRDAHLAPIIQRYGPPAITPHKNYYQSLVESIVSQQLSVKAADTILQRFITLFPGKTFPEPADLLVVDSEALRSAGLSRQKASYIQDVAVKILDGSVQFDHLDQLDNEAVIAELTAVKGVGVWTVHMFLIFCMGRLDVFPVGDLGIKNGMRALYGLSEKPTAEQLESIVQKNNWHPYESVASWYIWQSLDNKPNL
jgi:DNA-3-methyladenine glycosylase II